MLVFLLGVSSGVVFGWMARLLREQDISKDKRLKLPKGRG